jgi:hypothetical protein
MQKTLLIALACILGGVIFGAGAALLRSGQNQLGGDRPGDLVDGAWKTDFEIGSENASGALRARIARKGLFALKRTEAVYYARSTDGAGRELDVNCSYRLSGADLPAEWWSVTLYDEADYLAKNRDGAHSINRDDVIAGDDGWTAIVSGSRPDDAVNWISTNGAQTFDLTLRLYRPDLDYLMSGNVSGFPTVERLACSEGGVS